LEGGGKEIPYGSTRGEQFASDGKAEEKCARFFSLNWEKRRNTSSKGEGRSELASLSAGKKGRSMAIVIASSCNGREKPTKFTIMLKKKKEARQSRLEEQR